MVSFNHYAISLPPVSNADQITKITKHLHNVFDQSWPSAPPDELTAIDNLHQLFFHSPDACPTPIAHQNTEQWPNHKFPLQVPIFMPHIISSNDDQDTGTNPAFAPSHDTLPPA